MYLIRLTSGEEAAYRTLEELTKAVSSGVVSAEAEVFHKAASRWLPIRTHPDYRAALAARAAAPPEPPQPLAEAPTEVQIVQPRRTVESPQPVAAVLDPEPEPIAKVSVTEAASEGLLTTASDLDSTGVVPFPDPIAAPRRRSSRTFQRRAILALPLGLAVILVLGVWFQVLGPRLGQNPDLRGHSEGMPPAPTTPVYPDSLPDSVFTAITQPLMAARPDSIALLYPAPSPPLDLVEEEAPASQPRAEPRIVSRLGGTRNRMPSYFEAYADARAEMNEGLDYVRFQRVFSSNRFASLDSLRAARRMVVAAANILRVYRGREVMLEQTYRPGQSEERGSLREPFEAAQATRGLLADVDSLFGLLVAQAGEYSIRSEGISFRNRGAARSYASLRRDILHALAAWRDSSESSNLVTMPRLVRAVGAALPPPPSY